MFGTDSVRTSTRNPRPSPGNDVTTVDIPRGPLPYSIDHNPDRVRYTGVDPEIRTSITFPKIIFYIYTYLFTRSIKGEKDFDERIFYLFYKYRKDHNRKGNIKTRKNGTPRNTTGTN